MISFKEGVKLHGLTPQAVLGILVVMDVFRSYNRSPTITSVAEGEHSPKSLHYLGRAFDVRLPATDGPPIDAEEEECLFRDCRGSLDGDWDAVREKTHWHFEWDPKGPPR